MSREAPGYMYSDLASVYERVGCLRVAVGIPASWQASGADLPCAINTSIWRSSVTTAPRCQRQIAVGWLLLSQSLSPIGRTNRYLQISARSTSNAE
jgi:hypothetical protein